GITSDGLPLDAALALTGACLAALWHADPPLVALISGPMLLIYRALWVPLLRHKSRVDAQTGLYNSERLDTVLADAVGAAAKLGGRNRVRVAPAGRSRQAFALTTALHTPLRAVPDPPAEAPAAYIAAPEGEAPAAAPAAPASSNGTAATAAVVDVAPPAAE